ncbi:MAG TPA: CHAD domain-containing protein [Planctomycetota bacterium]|nr:CHAD domain-containing protein [Planctomycetota bacterium]
MKAPANLIDLTRMVCGAHAQTLDRSLHRLLLKPDDEAVHDVRVTCRRLRVVLKLIEPLYRKRMMRAARGRFRALLQALGPIRDAEVLGERAHGLSAKHQTAGLDELARLYAAQAELERIKAVATVERGHFVHLPRLIEALLRAPALSERNEARYSKMPLRKFARLAISERLNEIKRFSHLHAKSSAHKLHALRIAFKKLRYTGEFFSSAFPLKPLVKAAEKYQELLGALNDAEVAIATFEPCVRRRGNTAPESVDAALRTLVKSAYAERNELRETFAANWNEGALKKLRRLANHRAEAGVNSLSMTSMKSQKL